MSATDISRVIDRAAKDANFLNQINRTPRIALAAYDLTSEERDALLSGDCERLEALGVDHRTQQVWNAAVM